RAGGELAREHTGHRVEGLPQDRVPHHTLDTTATGLHVRPPRDARRASAAMVAALASTGKRPGPTLTAVTRIPHPPRGRAGRSGRGATRGRSWLARAALLPAAALAFLAADALAAPAASADGTGPTNFESLV